MVAETTDTGLWDGLYKDSRFHTVYPSEHVVRFLAGLGDGDGKTAVDIGCGAGRHTKLLTEFGYTVYPCDSSTEALGVLRDRLIDEPLVAPAVRADMVDLPHPDNRFDVALSYGVAYYGRQKDLQAAVAEMSRVLKFGGVGFMKLRTDRDWRRRRSGFGAFDLPGEPEHGMPLTFMQERYVLSTFGFWFDKVSYELAEETTNDRKRLNSDWLITVTK